MTTNDDDHGDEKKTVLSKIDELADVATAKLSDEEQRKRKGKAKIVIVSKEYKEEKKSEENRCFEHVPRKIRRTLRFPQPDFENPNGASSSSPCSVLPFENPYGPSTSSYSSHCSSLNYENYMARMMRRPPNPTYRSSPYSRLTDRTIPERYGLSQRWGVNRGFNEKPRVASFSRREMPRWLVHVMRDMNAQDATLIFEKALSATDVNPNHSRFLMPFNRLIKNEFLTPEEKSIVEEEDMDMDNDDERIEVGAILVDPRSVKWGVVIKRSEMMTCSGNKSCGYSLVCGWNDIVNANELKLGDNIVVWSFRSRGVLCFALVPVPLPLFL